MSNLLDRSSLVLTPTAYNNGEALCVKPEDGSGDFQFSRNSAATRVNAQGLVEDVQILSSNLVQNGNFSQIGSEQVSNGGFTQIGSEEVTNGNFLQEGSELLVNGDFATNASWNGDATISNGQLTKGVSGGLVYQGALDGNVKLWKIIVDVAEKNGASLTLYLGGVQIALNEGIQTLYIKNGTSNTFVGFNNGAGSIINSISVKEVGQNWNFNNWTLTNDNALLVDTGGYINQVGVFVVGKSYKISVNVKDYTSGSLRFDSNGQNLWTPSGSNTIATIYVYNLDRTNFLLEGDFRGTITDISIKEVGQDWTLGIGWSIKDGLASCDGTQTTWSILQQNNILPPDGSIVKIVANVSNYSSGNLYLKAGFADAGFQISANGTFTTYRVVNGSSQFRLQADLNFIGTITNISVKEVGQNWTLGSGVTIGENKIIGTNANSNTFQNVGIQANKNYKIQFTILDYSNGNVKVILNGSPNVTSSDVSSNGNYTLYLSSVGGSNGFLSLNLFNNFNGSITNISVIEITDDTNLPRINYKGFSYQDDLGSELVTNGDFVLNSDWLNFGSPTTSEQSTEQSHTGTYSWKVIADAESEGIFSPNNFNLTSGLTYSVSLWVYSVSGTLVKSGIANTNVSVFTTRTIVVGEWTNITYQATATTTGPAYISILSNNSLNFFIDDVSVKEYKGQEVVPDSGCGRWLFEPQSTNLIPYSENFSVSNWAKSNLSINSNIAASPSGIVNASKLIENSNLSTHTLFFNSPNTPVTSGQKYTISLFAKEGGRNIRISNAAESSMNVVYNLLNGTIISSGIAVDNSSVVNYGNGWYRCIMSFTASATIAQVNLALIDENNAISYQGDGTSGVNIWGVQVEQQSYETSYIPTDGQASGVTRNSDVCANGGSAASINSSEGALFGQFSTIASDNTSAWINLSDGTSNNWLFVGRDGDKVRAFLKSNGVVIFSNQTTPLADINKVALSYKSGDIRLYINGVQKLNLTSSFAFSQTLTRLDFGVYNGGPTTTEVTWKQVAVWKETLTDTELQELTTI
tara:strand:- start:1306 stop:4404 length:3099 start_codon:yes stop_codon:yes gene_type:complete